MSYQLSTLIPISDLTLTDRSNLRKQAIERGIARAVVTKVIAREDEAKVRHLQNIVDIPLIVLDQWNTNPLVGPLGTVQSVFQAVAAPQLANNRLAVFYKVAVTTAPIPVSTLAFREGAAAGTTYAIFDLEQLDGCLEPIGYFSEPVVYDPLRVMNIVATCRIITNLPARVILGCYIIEPGGPTIS